MIEDQTELPLDCPPSNVRSIEGGRAIAARDAHASFAVDTDTITTSLRDMAGYVVIAWNDEGDFSPALYCGSRNPFSPVMIPDLVRGVVSRCVLNGDPA